MFKKIFESEKWLITLLIGIPIVLGVYILIFLLGAIILELIINLFTTLFSALFSWIPAGSWWIFLIPHGISLIVWGLYYIFSKRKE